MVGVDGDGAGDHRFAVRAAHDVLHLCFSGGKQRVRDFQHVGQFKFLAEQVLRFSFPHGALHGNRLAGFLDFRAVSYIPDKGHRAGQACFGRQIQNRLEQQSPVKCFRGNILYRGFGLQPHRGQLAIILFEGQDLGKIRRRFQRSNIG